MTPVCCSRALYRGKHSVVAFRALSGGNFDGGNAYRTHRQTDMEAAESFFKQAFAHPFRPSLFRRGDALGLAAVRPGLQRVALRFGQRQRGSRCFIYVGFFARHAAQPFGDGHLCSAVENAFAKTQHPPVGRIDGGGLGLVAALGFGFRLDDIKVV